MKQLHGKRVPKLPAALTQLGAILTFNNGDELLTAHHYFLLLQIEPLDSGFVA